MGGELFTHLRDAGRFNDSAARFYAAEVLLTIDYLHARNVVYRDLKVEPHSKSINSKPHACRPTAFFTSTSSGNSECTHTVKCQSTTGDVIPLSSVAKPTLAYYPHPPSHASFVSYRLLFTSTSVMKPLPL